MNKIQYFKSVYRSLTYSNPKYFDPIDLERWVQLFIDVYSNLPKQFPKNKKEDEELTKEYSTLGIDITIKDKYEYSKSWFKPTFVQEFTWAWFDNKINLLATNSNRKFVLGDLFVDAAMCYSQEQDILKKIQNKYSIDSLIKELSIKRDWFHFREGIICLLRSCYFNKCTQVWIYSQDKTNKIIKGIIDNLKAIIDLNSIEQLGFATQAIMLVTNLYCRLGEQDKDQLSIIISNLFIKLLQDFQVYAIPNVFDFVKGATFLDQKVIEKNKQLVDNEVNTKNVVLETHQKQLVFAIWNLIKKINLNQLSISKDQCKAEFLKSLNLKSHMIEKFIVLFILNL